MKLSKTMQFTAIALVAGMVAIFAAGCGGGGGGAAAPAVRSGLMLNIELPRTAGTATNTVSTSCSDCADYVYLAEISVMEYAADGSTVTVAESDTLLYWDSATEYYTGDFFIDGLTDDNNLVCKIVATEYTESSSGLTRTANSLEVPAYLGALVEETVEGTTAYVDIDSKTTLATLVAIRYAMQQGVALSDTTVITPELIEEGIAYVESIFADGGTIPSNIMISPYEVVHASSDPFTPSNWSTAFTDSFDAIGDYVLGIATGSTDITAPMVSSFSPVDGSSVAADGAVFQAVFNEAMDGTVDLNDATTLANSGFSIGIAKSGGSSITINTSNATQYGTFSWGNTYLTSEPTKFDTLMFTLLPSATLSANGLSTLNPGSTYTIINWNAPSNVTDMAGNAVDTTTLTSTGTFSASDNVGPMLLSISPANGATNIAPTAVVVSMIFDESLDSSIDLNSQTVLDASQFSIGLSSSGGTTFSITQANALQYGTFSYATNSLTDDTVVFTLFSPSTLRGNGLNAPSTCRTYSLSVSVTTAPIADLIGNVPTTQSQSGSFDTSCI